MDTLPGVFTYASDCPLVLPSSAVCSCCFWANQCGPEMFDFSKGSGADAPYQALDMLFHAAGKHDRLQFLPGAHLLTVDNTSFWQFLFGDYLLVQLKSPGQLQSAILKRGSSWSWMRGKLGSFLTWFRYYLKSPIQCRAGRQVIAGAKDLQWHLHQRVWPSPNPWCSLAILKGALGCVLQWFSMMMFFLCEVGALAFLSPLFSLR